jgi:hypothetical protein
MDDGFIWSGAEDCGKNAVRHAIRESEQSRARLMGMKIRAMMDPPKAAPWHFPYRDHRTQKQVRQDAQRRKVPANG